MNFHFLRKPTAKLLNPQQGDIYRSTKGAFHLTYRSNMCPYTSSKAVKGNRHCYSLRLLPGRQAMAHRPNLVFILFKLLKKVKTIFHDKIKFHVFYEIQISVSINKGALVDSHRYSFA